MTNQIFYVDQHDDVDFINEARRYCLPIVRIPLMTFHPSEPNIVEVDFRGRDPVVRHLHG